MNRNEPDSHFDELDEQIHAALRVDVSPQQLERLEAFWQDRSRADRRRKQLQQFAAMAAAILLAGAASYQLWHRPSTVAPHENLLTDAGPATPVPSQNDLPKSAPAKSVSEDVPSISHGRPATIYEQFVFNARARDREMAQQRSAVAALDNAINLLAHNPSGDARQLLKSAELRTANAEQLLLSQLGHSNEPRERAILQLLSLCGTSRSTVPLLKLSRRSTLREQALLTIEQTTGIDGLANAATLTGDSRVRAAIYQRLFENEITVDAFLSLVQNDLLRDEVLEVADKLSEPMLNALLIRLNAEDPSTRLAAAFVLGHANGPFVTNSLIALVSENPASPTEAWLALMACRGQQAEQFLVYANQQPRLLGHFNRARVVWARTIH